MEVVDVTEDRPYDALVLDTAPTGHFLRLLELPAVALDWTHQVMRLLLKYRELVAPGELAERLLELARDDRVTEALLFRGLVCRQHGRQRQGAGELGHGTPPPAQE